MSSIHLRRGTLDSTSDNKPRFRTFQIISVLFLTTFLTKALHVNSLKNNDCDFLQPNWTKISKCTVNSCDRFESHEIQKDFHQKSLKLTSDPINYQMAVNNTATTTTSNSVSYLDDQILQYVHSNMYFASCFFGIITLTSLINLIVMTTFRQLSRSEYHLLMKGMHDYLCFKSIFVLGMVDIEIRKTMTWANWYLALGLLLATLQFYKRKLDCLISSNNARRTSIVDIGFRIVCLLLISLTLHLTVVVYAITTNSLLKPITLSLLADTLYELLYSIATNLKFIIFIYDLNCASLDKKASAFYYIDFIFQLAMLVLDLLHTVYLFWVYPLKQVAGLMCILRAVILIREITQHYKQHQNYIYVTNIMENTLPKATQEDLKENKDDCAICWEELKSARKLPCNHLFHDSCIRSWLEHETSCPICRCQLEIRNIPSSQDMLSDTDSMNWTTRIWDLHFPPSVIRANNLRSTQRLSVNILRDLQFSHQRAGARVYLGHESGLPIVEWSPQ